jgi:hypothetical protein
MKATLSATRKMLLQGALVAVLGLAPCAALGAGSDAPPGAYTESEAVLRRMDVHPTRPDSGIDNGYMVAYGHLLPRPYLVTVSDTLVFVNGVQVYPPLKTPEQMRQESAFVARADDVPPAVRARRDSIVQFTAHLQAIHDSVLPMVGQDSAWALMKSMLRGSPLVESLWVDTHGLEVKWVTYEYPVAMDFHRRVVGIGASLMPGGQRPTKESVARLEAGVLRSSLMAGRFVFYAFGTTVDDRGRTAARLKSILDDATLDGPDMRRRLDSLIIWADWLVVNCRKSEWNWVPKEER